MTSPTAVPIEKQIADMRNGGTSPEASVSSASSDHIAIAENPISVARPIPHPFTRVPNPKFVSPWSEPRIEFRVPIHTGNFSSLV